MKTKKLSNSTKTEYRELRLHEKEEVLCELIEDKLRYPDAYPLRSVEEAGWETKKKANRIILRPEEIEDIGLTRKQISDILERLEQDKRIYTYGMRNGMRIWTTPEYWSTPNLKNRVARFEKKTNTLWYGGNPFRLKDGSNQLGVCRGVFSRTSRSISEDEILKNYIEEDEPDMEQSSRLVLDAKNGLNKKVGADLFIYENHRIRLNKWGRK